MADHDTWCAFARGGYPPPVLEARGMVALVLDDRGVSLVHDRARPEPPAGYVRVRTLVAGVCNTDLELARGYMGFRGVLGHEFVGEALEGALAGRRVVGGINFGCGRCARCEAGLARHCAARRVLGIVGADGAFAQEFVIPQANLVAIPDSIATEDAVFSEPLAAACEILDQIAHIEPGRALVLGAGKLGPLVAQVLASRGFEVDLVGRHLEGLAWLADRGVRLVGAEPDLVGYPLVVEATGSTAGLETALRVTAPRGSVVLKTTVAAQHRIDLSPIVIHEIQLIGSRCGRMEPAIELLARGEVSVRPLIDAHYALADAESAFARAASRGVRKVLLRND